MQLTLILIPLSNDCTVHSSVIIIIIIIIIILN